MPRNLLDTIYQSDYSTFLVSTLQQYRLNADINIETNFDLFYNFTN